MVDRCGQPEGTPLYLLLDEQGALNLQHFIQLSMTLLNEWFYSTKYCTISEETGHSQFQAFLYQMEQCGILEKDELLRHFMRISIRNVTIKCYNLMGKHINYQYSVQVTISTFVRLVLCFVQCLDNDDHRVTLLSWLMHDLTRMLLAESVDYTNRNVFVPYHLMMKQLLFELSAPKRVFETLRFQILALFCITFHNIRPAKCPSFVFMWLHLITDQHLMNCLLTSVPEHVGWGMFAQLLIDLFEFMAPFLSNPVQSNPLKHLYNGTMRVLLLLAHDFPDFLCENWFYFINIIPNCCVQMRNLILSSYPSSMKIPGPLSYDWRIDSLPEIKLCPSIIVDFDLFIQPSEFKRSLDIYLTYHSPTSFKTDLLEKLKGSPDPGSYYNTSLINAIVLYIGKHFVTSMKLRNCLINREFSTNSSHMDLLKFLSTSVCNQGRYLLYSSIVNNLRYPNSHTVAFMNILLYLFESANSDEYREVIVRVLLERVIVKYPHPWGLTITFTELLQNRKYRLMDMPFTRCNATLQRLFECFKSSCDTLMAGMKSSKKDQ